MAEIDLKNRGSDKTDIEPKLQKLKNRLNDIEPLWKKLSPKKRKKILEDNVDPILSLAYSIYKYLEKKFFGEKYLGNGGAK